MKVNWVSTFAHEQFAECLHLQFCFIYLQNICIYNLHLNNLENVCVYTSNIIDCECLCMCKQFGGAQTSMQRIWQHVYNLKKCHGIYSSHEQWWSVYMCLHFVYEMVECLRSSQ